MSITSEQCPSAERFDDKGLVIPKGPHKFEFRYATKGIQKLEDVRTGAPLKTLSIYQCEYCGKIWIE